MSNGWNRMERRVERGPMSSFLAIGGAILVCCCIGGVALFVINPFQQVGRIINKTVDADNVISNYEWFKNRHEAVIAIDKKITTAKMTVDTFKGDVGPRSDWDREDKIEYSRLKSVADGLVMQRDDLAAEYNARSRQVNRSIFKAGDVELPSRL